VARSRADLKFFFPSRATIKMYLVEISIHLPTECGLFIGGHKSTNSLTVTHW